MAEEGAGGRRHCAGAVAAARMEAEADAAAVDAVNVVVVVVGHEFFFGT